MVKPMLMPQTNASNNKNLLVFKKCSCHPTEDPAVLTDVEEAAEFVSAFIQVFFKQQMSLPCSACKTHLKPTCRKQKPFCLFVFKKMFVPQAAQYVVA